MLFWLSAFILGFFAGFVTCILIDIGSDLLR